MQTIVAYAQASPLLGLVALADSDTVDVSTPARPLRTNGATNVKRIARHDLHRPLFNLSLIVIIAEFWIAVAAQNYA